LQLLVRPGGSSDPADGVGNDMPITLLDGILVGFTLVQIRSLLRMRFSAAKF